MFEGCVSLKDIEIAHTEYVGTIYARAFYGCTSLTSFSYPNITMVNESAFENCTSLTDFDFSLTSYIYAKAFRNTGIKELSLPSGSSLVAYAFADCKNLTKVSLPIYPGIAVGNKATYIGQFSGCTALKEVSLDISSNIPAEMFRGCTSLTTVNAPVAENIYANAFEGCTALKSFDFSAVSMIYEYAFKDCTGISSATIGETTEISSTSFAGWTAAQTLTIKGYTENDLTEEFVEEWKSCCNAKVVWGS
jgi:hypothetical protein